MQGKIFGIPLVLILLILGIALLVDLPIMGLNAQTQRKLDAMDVKLNEINASVKKMMVTPTVEPSAVTPTPKGKTPSVSPATRSGQIR